MLVQSSRTESIPGVQLCGDCKVGEPVELDRLPVGLGPVRRYDLQVGSNLKELGLPRLVRFLFRHLKSQAVVALAQDDDSVTGNVHSLQLLAFIHSIRIVHVVQAVHCLFDLLFILHIAGSEHLLAAAGVPRASLLHKLGEHTRLVAVMPLRCHPGEELLSHAAPRPVGDDLLPLELSILLRCLEGHKLPLAHDNHILLTVAAQLRECGGRLGVLALLPDDQLPVPEIQRLLGKIFLQRHGPHDRYGIFSIILLVKIRLDLRPLQINVYRRVHTDFSELLDPLIHTPQFCHFLTLLFSCF